ncbi:right-handed parallel beta-helix repeat-containing protein [Vibrio porteresiae]|uniref:Right-handed parallel beta-helix repeat-containing protein n=1 Tax=Vibrio porteresiae DSM 19223 TaxID=1123496 RepID=A0ABZ0QJI4_9VIBR|nr:right-handed parallel beta-helix repeat-containing protein [Vibrio porteresiae]WPC75601.1 right-handed parallel beta-helix repeat-containing protein [Vibrio porteresiae DSM 19223]
MNKIIRATLLTSLLLSCSSGAWASLSETMATRCEGDGTSFSPTQIYYVSPTGLASNSGANSAQAMDFQTALSTVRAGEMILLEAGTYAIDYQQGEKNTLRFGQSGSASSPIYVVTANCGRAVFDFQFPADQWVQNGFGFYVTGSYWYFRGIDITHAGYHGAYVTGSHNTFENMAFYDNRNTGLEINKGGAYNLVLNADSYLNYDPKKHGSMADGFGAKQEQGAGNEFIGCRAWKNSDDAFDLYDTDQKVIIKESWAFLSGIDYWSDSAFAGNGNGFKLGGNRAVGNHEIYRSIAFDNVSKGFDQNNNAGGVRVVNNTAYNNGINFGFGNSLSSGEKHYFRNNLSLDGSITVKNANTSNNSWDSDITVTRRLFENLNTSLATAKRQANGALPNNALFHIKADTALIDAGVAVSGIDYLGSAPDLGAIEKQ